MRESTMKVTTISANIRYSQDTGHGAWKVVELGAEAQASLSSKAVEIMKRLETAAEQRRREAARPPGPVGIARPDEPESGR